MKRHITFDDAQLTAALEELAGRPEPGPLVVEVLRSVDSLPQRPRPWWRLPPATRLLSTPIVVGSFLVAVVLASTIGVATGLIPLPSILAPDPSPTVAPTPASERPSPSLIPTSPPTPAPTPLPEGVGPITIQGDGCVIRGIDPGTSTSRPLSNGIPDCFAAFASMDMAWSPDGSTLAIGYEFFCGGCGSADARAAIDNQVAGLWLLHADTGVAEQPERCETACAVKGLRWSADGSRIAYLLNGELRLRVLGDADPIVVRSIGESGIVRDIRWAPDGSRLAVLTADGRISMQRSDGSGETSAWEPGESFLRIDWSPDGRTLAVTSANLVGTIELDPEGDLPAAPSIRVLHESVDATFGGVHWSRDGNLVAFDLAIRPSTVEGEATWGAVEYWVAPADGGQPTRVFTSPWAVLHRTDAAWSPSSDAVAFTLVQAPPDGFAETFVVSPSGTELSRVRHAAPAGGFLAPPAWRPDVATGN